MIINLTPIKTVVPDLRGLDTECLGVHENVCFLSRKLKAGLILFMLAMSSAALSVETSDVVDQGTPANNAEIHLPSDQPIEQWTQTFEVEKEDEKKKVEIKKVLQQNIKTLKLDNVIEPIEFKSGQEGIPERYVTLLRTVLDGMKNRLNVRLHFIGHTDDVKLSGSLQKKYGDNVGLSRERAGTTAEFFQRALHLPPEAISFDGMGEHKPVASNKTEAGRAKNRRVEVQVWYDQVDEEMVEKQIRIKQDVKRIQTCRIETVCKVRYKAGHSRRARLKNLVPPLRYEEGMGEIPSQFLTQLKEALYNLRNKNNVQIKLIGHTDNIPLTGRLGRIYGEHVALSKAHARRLSLAVQEALKLPNNAIDSDGKGAAWPVASNDVATGRAANRRIEVEFWHDDPLQNFSGEPQLCPETAGAETVTRVFEPPAGNVKPVYFEKGKPVILPGTVERLKRIMAEVANKGNVRIRLIGYTNNARLDRRTAMVYGDDIGLSTSRARRVMETIKTLGNFSPQQLEFEGKGFVHSDDVVNAGFLEVDESRVEARIVYDDLEELDNQEGLEIDRITRAVKIKNPFALNLMRISIDGTPVDDIGKSSADVQRCTDVALEKARVNFNFDSINIKPRLNVTAWPNTISYRDDLNTSFPENLLTFKSYTNYGSFINKSEVRIFEKDQSTRDAPVSVIELDKKGEAEWQASYEKFIAPVIELKYLLRVYDKDGNFDETKAQPLWLLDEVKQPQKESDDADANETSTESELLIGYGENRLALHNIPIAGGTIKVSGTSIPKDHSVWFAGHSIPLTDNGEFISEEILPAGIHSVEVAVLDQSGNGELFLRDLELKKNDWFYVGIADITASLDSTNGPAALITGDQTHYDNDTAIDGRIAFYTKGKFGDNWELTASADTLEGPLDDLFSNFMDKSPDAVFRRIDPDYYYPTFGDDSTLEEMAPTLGKFYIKLKHDKNFGMWGNFNVDYTDNNLAHVDRNLYGANYHYENNATTDFGEKTFKADLFAAEPGTLGARDEFRGTGGSLYYLRHQDILTGSDRLRIEIRDKISGLVLEVKNLLPALDYDIDSIQGRILLSEPLSASSNDNLIVDSGNGGGNEVYLVARYEYSPGFEETSELSTGGRLHYWLNDNIKLGTTFSAFGDAIDKDNLNAIDITVRKNVGTWVKFEQATSRGISGETALSNDGGYDFTQIDPLLNDQANADASRFDASVRFEDMFDGVKGKAIIYSQELKAGYSAPGLLALTDTKQSGAIVEYPVSDDLNLKLKADEKSQDSGLKTAVVELDADYSLDDNWKLSAGVRDENREDNSAVVALTQTEGDRTDLALKASYDSKQDWSSYGYLQDTVKIRGTLESNNRLGVGGQYRVTDRLKLNGELSSGELGTAANLGTDYLLSDRTNMYLNYVLENEQADNGVRANKGNLSSGFKTQYSDSASIYVEERYSHGDTPTGLTHSMGTDLAPTDRLNIGANVDIGTLEDQTTGAITERNAIGFRIGYNFDAFKYAGAIEYREDNAENPDTTTSERITVLYKNSFKYQLNPDWRIIGKLNHSTSESSLGEFYNGDFTEAVIGYGYRPVNNDRLNALFKYTYFYNLPATDQVTINNTAAEYIQKSEIISVDVMYDITQRWSLGGKYAHRFGELSMDRVNPEFFDSTADLYVVRADWHFAHRWDALLEGRMLSLPDAGDTRSGTLFAIYRHIKKNIKLGIGYNFTDFSDDLTDLDYDSKGLFINFVAKI